MKKKYTNIRIYLFFFFGLVSDSLVEGKYFSGSFRARDDVRIPYSSGFLRKSGFEAVVPGFRLTGTASPPTLLLELDESEPEEFDSLSEPEELPAAP